MMWTRYVVSFTKTYILFTFSELSLVGLALDLVD